MTLRGRAQHCGMSPDSPNLYTPCRRAAACTRREIITHAALLGAVAVLSACAEHVNSAPADTEAVTVVNDVIVVHLRKVPALAAIDSAYVIGELNVIVLRVGDRDYRAFSNVCTHAGCGIYIFADRRMRCQCHGSEFDTSGANVAGPAPAPLRQYSVTLSLDAGELRIVRAGA